MEYSKVGRGGAIFSRGGDNPEISRQISIAGSSIRLFFLPRFERCANLANNARNMLRPENEFAIRIDGEKSNSIRSFRYANSFYRKRFNGRESVSPLQVYEYAHARRRELIKK